MTLETSNFMAILNILISNNKTLNKTNSFFNWWYYFLIEGKILSNLKFLLGKNQDKGQTIEKVPETPY